MGSPVYCGRTIPTELCLQIAELCDRQTLKNLRITNKATEAWASKELFKEINVAFFEQSFDHVHELSSSVLASYVKKIVVWRGVLSVPVPLYNRKSLFDEELVDPIFGWEVDYPLSQTLQAFWQVYSTLQAEQLSILDITLRDLRLSNAIASLPKLSSIQVQAGIVFDISGYKPELRMLEAAMKDLPGAKLLRDRCLAYFAIEADLPSASRVADHIMFGLSRRRSGTLVSMLDMSMAFSRHRTSHQPPFLPYHPAHARAITVPAFASLTKVAINNTFKGTVDHEAETEILHCLQHCLRLKHLQLYLSTVGTTALQWPTDNALAQLAATTYWPELEVVKLRVLTLTDQLINFLRYHTTITSLSIYSSRLDDVPAFLNQLPTLGLALKELNLRQLYMYSWSLVWYFYDTKPSQAEEAWLMTGQGGRPFWKPMELRRREDGQSQQSLLALPAYQQGNVGIELTTADEGMAKNQALVSDELCYRAEASTWLNTRTSLLE